MSWTTAQTARALVLRKRGFTAAAIGKELGATKNAVLGKLYRMGLLRKGKNPHWTGERRAKFTALWLSGAPVSQIAQEMSMGLQTAYSRRCTMGLPGRRELKAGKVS